MSLLHLVFAALVGAQDRALANPPVTAAVEEAEEGPSAEYVAWQRALATSLRGSASARDRALGTQVFDLEPAADQPRAKGGRALREAAAAAPTDAIVQAMWANTSDDYSGCDASSPCPERRLALSRIEPGNGIAWVPMLQDLYPKGSEAEIESVLLKIASAERFDDHFADQVGAWDKALSAVPQPRAPGQGPFARHPRETTMVAAIAYAAAMTISSGWQPLTRLCNRSNNPQAPARRFELCAQAGRGLMRGGSSYVSESMGFALVRISGLATADDRLADRRARWRMQAMIDLSPVLETPSEFKLYFGDLLSTGVEARAMELLMHRHGIALEPPADWKSPNSDG